MDEIMVSGYCRCLDCSRIVTAELEDGKRFIDCDFGHCPHEASCPIAAKLQNLTE